MKKLIASILLIVALGVLAMGVYFYLYKPWWQPKPGTTWQWQLQNYPVNTKFPVDMYSVDLFETPTKDLKTLKQQGKTVICYFSAGTWEPYRPDSRLFPQPAIGNQLKYWPKEHWLNIRDQQVRNILIERIRLAKQRGCDGIEPDNIDAYLHETGFNITKDDQLAFNRWLAQEAHRQQLSIGLKNDLEHVSSLVRHFDWAINESCFKYNECHLLIPFVKANKAVFIAVYEGDMKKMCRYADNHQFSLIMKKRLVKSDVKFCPPLDKHNQWSNTGTP